MFALRDVAMKTDKYSQSSVFERLRIWNKLESKRPRNNEKIYAVFNWETKTIIIS
jgi:hypothetical protein